MKIKIIILLFILTISKMMSAENAIIIKSNDVLITSNGGKSWSKMNFYSKFKDDNGFNNTGNKKNNEVSLFVKPDLMRFTTDGGKSWEKTVEQIEFDSKDEVIFFPNPVVDILHLINLKEQDVCIFNVQGAKIFSGRDTTEIDIHYYMPGIYFLKIGNKIYILLKLYDL